MPRILRLPLILVAVILAACSSDSRGPNEPTELMALVVSSAGIGNGRVISSPPLLDCTITGGVESGACAVSVPAGTVVTLQAQFGTGWDFGTWGDDCEGSHSALQCTLTADRPLSVTAAFLPANRSDLLFLSGPNNLTELRRRFGFADVVAPVLPAGTVVHEMATNWDGNLVALARRDNFGAYSIWTMKPDGSQLQQRITGEYDNRMPSFSPDGQRIAFMSTRANGAPDIWVANINGSNAVNLTPELPGIVTSDTWPSWSPDGTRIAFISNRTGFPALWMMNADGSNQVRVTDVAEGERDVSWAPDSRKVVFSRVYAGGESAIVIRDLITNLEQRWVVTGNQRHPAWSPDGSRIVFSSNVDGGFDLYSMAPDGTGLANLTNTPEDEARPVWLRARGPAPQAVR